MEIDQYLYDLTESGEAIVAYKMTAENGGSVEICNLSALVLSWRVPAGEAKQMVDIASGRLVRGLRGMQSDNWGGVNFSEMLWESRVETNRVVMSLQWEADGVGVMSEVVFDYDDDNTLEITYIACPDSPCELDLTHKLQFDIEHSLNILSDTEPTQGVYSIKGAQRSILSEVATINCEQMKLEILSSHSAIYSADGTFATISSPTVQLQADERYVQKSLFKPL